MIRIIFRNFFVGLTASALVFAALKFWPSLRATDDAILTCKNAPTARCLTGLGVDLAMSARSLPPYLREVDMLAHMGRIEDALTLELRVLSEKARPPENIEVAANRRLASHRITSAIRNGIDLDTAIDRTPDVDPGDLWISALDLLGRNPYGGSTDHGVPPDGKVLDVVSEMAQRITVMAQVEPDRSQKGSFMDAAELQTALGNRTEVIHLLGMLPKVDNLHLNPSEDLVRLVGSKDFLRLYRKAGGRSPDILLALASAETDASLAREYLERAFIEFSSKDPWPDLVWMERTVKRAAGLGFQKLALNLAQEFAEQADTAISVLPPFTHIRAARTLIAAGAGEDVVRDRLERAESSVARSDGEIEDANLGSRVIGWSTSPLIAEARREMAKLRARMGEIDTTIKIMDGIDDPVFSWNDVLTSEIPIETTDLLLNAVNDALSSEELAFIKAQYAQEILFHESSEEQRSWAQATATALLRTEQLKGHYASPTYGTLRRVGARLKDQDMQQLALERMAQAALKSRNYGELITAGFVWWQSDLAP